MTELSLIWRTIRLVEIDIDDKEAGIDEGKAGIDDGKAFLMMKRL